MLEKIFIICNKEEEKERYNNMEKQIINSKIDKNLFEYFCFCWKTDIELERKNNKKILYNNYKIHNLNDGEISILKNHIELFKKIRKEYSNGEFLILESDMYVFEGMKFNKELFLDNTILHIRGGGGWCYHKEEYHDDCVELINEYIEEN